MESPRRPACFQALLSAYLNSCLMSLDKWDVLSSIYLISIHYAFAALGRPDRSRGQGCSIRLASSDGNAPVVSPLVVGAGLTDEWVAMGAVLCPGRGLSEWAGLAAGARGSLATAWFLSPGAGRSRALPVPSAPGAGRLLLQERAGNESHGAGIRPPPVSGRGSSGTDRQRPPTARCPRLRARTGGGACAVRRISSSSRMPSRSINRQGGSAGMSGYGWRGVRWQEGVLLPPAARGSEVLKPG